MNNPKTTVAGYLLLGAAVLTLAGHLVAGGLGANDVINLMAALGGLGLVCARDGGR